MRLKLKKILTLSASLSLLIAVGFTQLASADSSHLEFACADGSTGIAQKTSKNSKGQPQVAITCKSGAKVLYENYDGKQASAVSVSCPGAQKIGTAVDTPNKPTSKYIVYCVNVSGAGDHAVTNRTNATPTVKVTQATNATCADGSAAPGNDTSKCPQGGQDVSDTSDPAASDTKCSTAAKCDLVTKYINPFINFLAALVGVAVTISIVVGGIQYASSAGDPQAAAAAKARIRNAIIALITFIFLYALLNFLIPGGLL
jgi:hypothetical protein